MTKYESTVPGMTYPSGRDYPLKTCFGFLEGRRKDDGAEGLWRIYDNLYDLDSFIRNHPGGSEWLTMTRGTDITEAFEVHHITDKAERLLPKFFVRKAEASRSLAYTFDSSGFYKKFKARAREALKDVDFHTPSPKSKRIADSMVTMAILGAIIAVMTKSWMAIAFSALFLTWTVISAHNFFHMRDNFRMFYFDMSLMSSKEWRISHILSHHLYPNTLWDMEIYTLEPFIAYMPTKDKTLLYRLVMLAFEPLFFGLCFFGQAVKRYYSIYTDWKSPEFRDIVPFFLPIIMSFFAASPFEAVKTWLCIIILSSFIFKFIGLTAAHHHPEIFHDGDVCRKDPDWGLMQLDATRDRKVIDDSLFLVLTNFGSHGMHHLLPTVDHAYLELCVPAFIETCREFGVEIEKYSSWELIKGQFQQLMRIQPRKNYRGGPDCGPCLS
ncbi:cytochrome b5-related-like isoform X1 [Nasonia vitripennis]|uniref:Cytochrome b5-related protein n=1 Tax=Nasonia vitripennis TaxID=7425 RepID=A0A7M6UVL0_NASVI|nr:cytochrome b5-related-like [Nasonia vitripennis]XP_031778337.1 cytochrome b5-related-like isoform X1 [Nasonia vitripennis]